MTINGLVLVGGQSSRMKEAKAHLRFDNKAQWQRAHDALAPHCEKIFFSVSAFLDKAIPVEKDLLIADSVDSCGPLSGIISAFKHDAHKTWFVLACDMFYFSNEAAFELISKRDITKLATCYHDLQKQPEPLAALYEPAIFSYLLDFYDQKIYCPRQICKLLDVNLVKPKDNKFIANINHKFEYENITKNYNITIYYYASLRQARGCAQENISTPARTIGELYNYLAYKYNFMPSEVELRFAKNDNLVGLEEHLAEGDRIVLIPPVSGG